MAAPFRSWRAVVACCWLLAAASAQAWSGHTLCTWQALEGLPELAGQRVRAQPLEQFVAAQGPALKRLLAEHERRAREEPGYPPRPDDLAFRDAAGAGAAADAAASATDRFILALRLNPFIRRTLYLQLRPGAPAPAELLHFSAVTTLASGAAARENRYVRIDEGQEVSALDVVATAANEPDYGLDLRLYSDSGTPHGLRMGLGAQPFGNPALEYGSQAPLHMAFHHESPMVYLGAGFLRRTMADARIELFSELARFAFESGHPYWGWRFTGWALHYVQDLTQPYHATALPGVGTLRLLLMNFAAVLGFEGPKNAAVTLVSNRHLVLETYQHRRMLRAMAAAPSSTPAAPPRDALLAALSDTRGDAAHWHYQRASARTLVSREAHDAAAALDAQLERSFPSDYTADPKVSLGLPAELLEMEDIARQHSASEHQALEQRVAALLRRLGTHSRALVRALVPGAQPALP